MSIQVINSKGSEDLTSGERYTLEQKIKPLFNKLSTYVYIQPIINGVKPDFILIDKNFGVIIIEIKDWSDDYLQSATRQLVVCDEKKYKNPIPQINRYKNIISNNISDIIDFTDDYGDCTIPVQSVIFFINLSKEKINEYSSSFSSKDIKVFNKNMLRKLTLKQLVEPVNINLSDKEVDALRGAIIGITIPTNTIKNTDEFTSINDIKVLDIEQEQFSKKIPNGHYMVTGLPGSGKTVVLLTRAIHLLQENENWNILIVTYTQALSIKLKLQLKAKIIDLDLSENILKQIQVKTFHKLCYDIVGSPSQPKERRNENYYNEFWPKEASNAIRINSSNEKYDCVLIDEYQDFHIEWFNLCRLVCKKNTEGENLFLAGDRLQRIYDVPWSSYKEIGINIQGRSKLLKKSYRTNPNHMDFALKFLSLGKGLQQEISKFYELDRLNIVKPMENHVNLIQGDALVINKYLKEMIYNISIYPSDILVLCHNKYEINSVISSMSSELRQKIVTGKNPVDGKTLITTYHSSKGLEAKYCILFSVDSFNQDNKNRTLMYVGMTRASKKLFIHYGTNTGFAKEINEILNYNNVSA